MSSMRGIDTPVRKVRRRVFKEVANLAYHSQNLKDDMEALPYKIVDYEEPKYWESVYRDRAIIRERIRLAMGMSLRPENREHPGHLTQGLEESNIDEKYYEPPLMQVIPSACNVCPENHYEVTSACMGCVAHPCHSVCPRGAISMENGKSVIDFCVCNISQIGVNGNDVIPSCQAEHLIEQMYAPVENHSAAVALPVSPVAGNAARTVNAALNAEDPSEFVFVVNFLYGKEVFIPPSVLMYGEHNAVSVGGGDHLFKFIRPQTNGFFADNIYLMIKKFDANGFVRIVRNGDDRKIDAPAVEQRLHRVKRGDTRILFKNPVSFGIDVESTDDLENFGHFFKSFNMPTSRHSAVTDNGNSDLLFHNFLPKRFSKAFLAFPF